ncbi:hypothetical protein L3X38_038048 [Prunus dulcis]|uniref:Reverse transcriptase Ty1/copia-type domain-containing protein n=1 Tax=Prunus dulcis TaxID=3755 RepID=A0AAD4YR64_PRUDU|nr:hypothetical protein L3X38_038048 [Prunus dulcis]
MSLVKNDQSTPLYQNQEEEVELFYEILLAPDPPSALVPHQSPYEEVIQLANISVPNSLNEALEDSKWKEAMNEEMRALQKSATWELVPLPHKKKTVGYRWIYTIKLKTNGSIEIYKAKLVANGYTQRYVVYYQETFALVAKINTIRVLLSLTANLDWPLH